MVYKVGSNLSPWASQVVLDVFWRAALPANTHVFVTSFQYASSLIA